MYLIASLSFKFITISFKYLGVTLFRLNDVISFFIFLECFMFFRVFLSLIITSIPLSSISYSQENQITSKKVIKEKDVNFTNEYIKLNKNKFRVEVPEVHELVNILVAMSEVGQKDHNMVDNTTKYHTNVLKHFLKYKNHPIMNIINKGISKPMDLNSYMFYYGLKMSSCSYYINSDNKIVHNGIIKNMSFSTGQDITKNNLELIQDFSNKSHFRDFYNSHLPYYNQLIDTYKILNPIDKMKAWLENKFNFEYGNYYVIFSPLVGGAHATQRYEDNDFNLTVMHICRAEYSNKYNKPVNELLESRVVFTEIDHNFVNPVSDKKIEQINKAFSNRKKWVNDELGKDSTKIYKNAYMVFNEYMTWAVYSLYAYDNYPRAEVDKVIKRMEDQMVNDRFFIKFKEFNQELIKEYDKSRYITVDDLYKSILDWSEKQNS